MIAMKQDDKAREERREREERKRETQRQAELIAQLKAARPVVPQLITIHEENLTRMREKDDLELYINQLQAALVASEVHRHKWKRYIHSQLTLESKQKMMPLLQDAAATYDDIRAALMRCSAMPFATTAEAVFSPIGGEGDKPTPRQLAAEVKRWLDKLSQETETVNEAMEKVAVAYLRSKLIPELKNYLDLTEANTMLRYLMINEEWERSNTHKNNLYRHKGIQGNNSQDRQGKQGSVQSGLKRNVTCFHCGKQGHISRDCRSRIASDSNTKQATDATTTTPVVSPVVAPGVTRNP